MPKAVRKVLIDGDIAFVLLTRGRIAVIDAHMAEKVSGFNWICAKSGRSEYASRTSVVDGKRVHIHMHRVISCCPDLMQVDHIDGNGLNNRRCNLRIVTQQENAFNRKTYANNSTGAKGVHRHGDGRWRAQIRKSGKLHHLGLFKSIEDAHNAYVQASKSLHGEFGCAGFAGRK